MSTNPLAKHFRTPSIYIKLPSNGRYWPEGTLEMTATGEIPVLSMTARDEILLRTPDALMNGEGMVQVIQSCVPNIKDAWKMPSIDVDAVLIAIRIASYGDDMDVTAKCPHCGEVGDYTTSLQNVLASIQTPEFGVIEVDGLKIKLKPVAYFATNQINRVDFEEERMLQFIADDSIPDEQKKLMFVRKLDELVDVSMMSVSESTEYIEMSNGDRVTDPKFIKEYYMNAERTVMGRVRDQLAKIKKEADIKPMTITCNECEKQSLVELEFDYSSFFANGS